MKTRYKILLLTLVGTLLIACQNREQMSMESIAQADLDAQQQRREQKMRLMQLMANELPLYRSLPVDGLGQADQLLIQGTVVKILDENIFTDDRKKSYLYVEVLSSGVKGYVLQEYLIEERYQMGLTNRYTTHYFQPDYRTGASSSIFLPAYTAIFSDDASNNTPFIAYSGVDLQGYPLKGFLERDAVIFTPNLINARNLYNQAFFSNSVEQQFDLIQQLRRSYAQTPFVELGNDLANIRNLSNLGRSLRLFDQRHRAVRSEQFTEQVIPVYSQPNEQSSVLGYITDDRILELTAGYGTNSDLTETQSPFGWYLIDLRGWVKAESIVIQDALFLDSNLSNMMLSNDVFFYDNLSQDETITDYDQLNEISDEENL